MARTDKSTGNYNTYEELVEAISKETGTMREISNIVGVAPGTVSNIRNLKLLDTVPLNLNDYWKIPEEIHDEQ